MICEDYWYSHKNDNDLTKFIFTIPDEAHLSSGYFFFNSETRLVVLPWLKTIQLCYIVRVFFLLNWLLYRSRELSLFFYLNDNWWQMNSCLFQSHSTMQMKQTWSEFEIWHTDSTFHAGNHYDACTFIKM